MALPQITYDPGSGVKTVSFPTRLTDLKGRGRIPNRQLHRTRGGVVMYHFEHAFYQWTIELKKFTRIGNEQFIEDVRALWSWASQGGKFSFALDSADTVDTTLTNAEAAGSTTIEVPDTTGIVAGNKLRIMSAKDGWQLEIVTVANPIVANVSFDITSGLKFNYAAGDIVRSTDFYPNCVAVEQKEPLDEQPANVMDFSLTFETFVDLV